MALSLVLIAAATAPAGAQDRPVAARAALRAFFEGRCPGVALDDYANGPYAIDPEMRPPWDEITQMP